MLQDDSRVEGGEEGSEEDVEGEGDHIAKSEEGLQDGSSEKGESLKDESERVSREHRSMLSHCSVGGVSRLRWVDVC